MSGRTQRSAEGEPWWPEFQRDYGRVPLRELARRFGTNPRRLRRAAQRNGLCPEPEVVTRNAHLLGRQPDATLADRLGVTVEHIAGARRRRRIPPYDPKKVRARQRASARRGPPRRRGGHGPHRRDRFEGQAPARRRAPRRRVEPDPDVVVVRRRKGPAPRRSEGGPRPSAPSRFRITFVTAEGEEASVILPAENLLDAARKGARYGDVLSVEAERDER